MFLTLNVKQSLNESVLSIKWGQKVTLRSDTATAVAYALNRNELLQMKYKYIFR